jgi:hypothetical protein
LEGDVFQIHREEAGPTASDLAAIEAEWPLVEAELTLLDAEIRMLSAVGGPSPLDWRRLRRAEHRVLAVRLRLATAPAEDSQARAGVA